MGLDVTALSKARFMTAEGDGYNYDDMLDQGYEYAYPNRDFADRADGCKAGYYSYEQRFDFPAGSYSSYNAFRDWLSHVALGVPASTAWNNPEEYADKPFFELIHFADNEGIIGPGPAKRIAQAFAEHDEQARDDNAPGSYYEEYVTWRRAFELAADDGLVEFH
jgi:hypothetical protein